MQHELLAERLVEQRKKFSITKLEASKRMNLSQAAYVRYENGTRKPNYATINLMARVLETSAEYLTGQTDDPTSATITITKENDPEKFEIISKIKEYDEYQLHRLMKYIEKINEAN